MGHRWHGRLRHRRLGYLLRSAIKVPAALSCRRRFQESVSSKKHSSSTVTRLSMTARVAQRAKSRSCRASPIISSTRRWLGSSAKGWPFERGCGRGPEPSGVVWNASRQSWPGQQSDRLQSAAAAHGMFDEFGGLPIARDAGLIQDHRLASDISALVGKERGRQIVPVAASGGSGEAVRRGG
jgi:hypothetical protein